MLYCEFGVIDILIILYPGAHNLKTISLEPRKIIQLLKYKVIVTPQTQIVSCQLDCGNCDMMVI